MHLCGRAAVKFAHAAKTFKQSGMKHLSKNGNSLAVVLFYEMKYRGLMLNSLRYGYGMRIADKIIF